jgi:prepilin-type N-terminal cleavage/methylation domain-containing protein
MGFSLVELMTVITVLGILLAISVPAGSGYLQSSRLVGAVNTLVADIHQTRALASMQRRTYQIAFDSTSYSVVHGDPPAAVRTRALPRGITCAASDTATFFAWGLTVPMAVTVANSADSTTLQVSANGSVSHD